MVRHRCFPTIRAKFATGAHGLPLVNRAAAHPVRLPVWYRPRQCRWLGAITGRYHMRQPAIVSSAPAALSRRAIAWWLTQVKHALPPTIFFFVGFNLILYTKRLILQEHGIEFSGFFTSLVAALLVGKAVLVTDNLPFMRRFDGAPMIQPILFKSAIYWICVLIARLAEEFVHFVAADGAIAYFGDHLAGHFSWARF